VQARQKAWPSVDQMATFVFVSIAAVAITHGHVFWGADSETVSATVRVANMSAVPVSLDDWRS
jgi:hypothetical protein